MGSKRSASSSANKEAKIQGEGGKVLEGIARED